MDGEFRDAEMERRFVDSRLAVRAWGVDVARKYVVRILELSRARNQADLRTPRSLRLHALRGRRRGQHAIDLHGRWRLIVTLHGEAAIVEEVTNHYDD